MAYNKIDEDTIQDAKNANGQVYQLVKTLRNRCVEQDNIIRSMQYRIDDLMNQLNTDKRSKIDNLIKETISKLEQI